MHVLRIIAVVCLFASAVGRPALGQVVGSASDWRVRPTLYAWLTGVKGDLATLPGLPPASVDASVGDVLDNLDFAFMAVLRLNYEKFGVLADFAYSKTTSFGTFAGPEFSLIELGSKNFIGTFALGWHAVKNEQTLLDVTAGTRVWSVDTRLILGPGTQPQTVVEGSETWVDPVVGAMLNADLNQRISAIGVFDVGGFGVSSDLTWQLYGGIGVGLSTRLGFQFGYRYLVVDYKNDDGFLYDVAQHGFLIGITGGF